MISGGAGQGDGDAGPAGEQGRQHEPPDHQPAERQPDQGEEATPPGDEEHQPDEDQQQHRAPVRCARCRSRSTSRPRRRPRGPLQLDPVADRESGVEDLRRHLDRRLVADAGTHRRRSRSIRPQSLSVPTCSAVHGALMPSTVAVGKVTPGAANVTSSVIRSTSAPSGHSSRRPTSAATPATARAPRRASRAPRATSTSASVPTPSPARAVRPVRVSSAHGDILP